MYIIHVDPIETPEIIAMCAVAAEGPGFFGIGPLGLDLVGCTLHRAVSIKLVDVQLTIEREATCHMSSHGVTRQLVEMDVTALNPRLGTGYSAYRSREING
jgi:hypothetical protein